MRRATSRLRLLATIAVIGVALVACGDDSGGAAPGTPGGPAPAPPAQPKDGAQLSPRTHIEDRVPPEERATLRHQFHDRDFSDNNRDPFTSMSMLTNFGSGAGSGTQVVAKIVECHSRIVAQNYSYADLRLVGIVHQGVQNKVLMMDPGNLGRIIATGECVGKEKAVVEEITQNHVTFLVTPEAPPGQGSRQPERHSVQLHERDLDVTSPGDLSQPEPDVEAPSVMPATSRGGPAPSGPTTSPAPAGAMQPAASR